MQTHEDENDSSESFMMEYCDWTFSIELEPSVCGFVNWIYWLYVKRAQINTHT